MQTQTAQNNQPSKIMSECKFSGHPDLITSHLLYVQKKVPGFFLQPLWSTFALQYFIKKNKITDSTKIEKKNIYTLKNLLRRITVV